MFLNVLSVRNNALDICNYIMEASVDLALLRDFNQKSMRLTVLKSFARQSGTGGSWLFYIEPL